jgi:hypothetical protein
MRLFDIVKRILWWEWSVVWRIKNDDVLWLTVVWKWCCDKSDLLCEESRIMIYCDWFGVKLILWYDWFVAWRRMILWWDWLFFENDAVMRMICCVKNQEWWCTVTDCCVKMMLWWDWFVVWRIKNHDVLWLILCETDTVIRLICCVKNDAVLWLIVVWKSMMLWWDWLFCVKRMLLHLPPPLSVDWWERERWVCSHMKMMLSDKTDLLCEESRIMMYCDWFCVKLILWYHW